MLKDMGDGVMIGSGTLLSVPVYKRFTTPYGESGVCKFSLQYEKANKQKNEKAKYKDCQAWGELAGRLSLAEKGCSIFLTGTLKDDSYTNKEGTVVSKDILEVDCALFSGSELM